ncbi:MAG TPA: alpha/beta fold hydrolase [Longimicrobium sp.]|jgi:pimeloyl-ACP methyl ester carboxylesterase
MPAFPLGVRLLRAWFRVAGHLLPGIAERQAARLFLTPKKRPATPQAIGGVQPREVRMEVEGEHLVGWTWGDDGPAVLLIHGWSGRAADMAAIGARLAAEGMRAIAFDMPAHGASAGRRTSLAVWMKILPEMGGRYGPLSAVVGHSFGGAAAILSLDAGLDARRAVLIAPPTGPAYFLEKLRGFIGLHERRAAGMERHLVAMVGRRIAEFDADRAAVRLAVPGLILHDPADSEVPFAHAEAISKAWRGSVLVPMPGEGHNRILKSPAALDRISEFLLARDAQPAPARADALAGD